MNFKLDTYCLLTVPLYIFDKDFSFIVNGQEFKTSRIIANLLSPKICKNQASDPTLSQFIIKTKNRGNFQYFLNLFTFQHIVFPVEDIPFIDEVIQILDNKSLSFEYPDNSKNKTDVNNENIFDQLKEYLIYPMVNSQLIDKYIEGIASNFYIFDQDLLFQKMKNMDISVIERILQSSELFIESEDQLISIINRLYLNDSNMSALYQYVDFTYVNEVEMSEFLKIFNFDDLSRFIWEKISNRLHNKVYLMDLIYEGRYHNMDKVIDRLLYQIPHDKNYEFDGIINSIDTNRKTKIVTISSSNIHNNHNPENATKYDDLENGFSSESENAFICFNFNKFKVIPKSYTIRSWNSEKNCSHPRGWVIEGSNDNYEFEILDEQRDCSLLNGKSLVCTFNINNPQNKRYQYLRMRTIMPDWADSNNLDINSIDFNGAIISSIRI